MSTNALQKKMLDYIGCTAAALEIAQKEASARTAQAEKVAEAVPQIVDLLKKHDHIDAGQVKEATEVLKDPVKTLEVLRRVVEKTAAARIGTPTGNSKTAAAKGGPGSSFIGSRSAEPRESDQRFLSALGLA